MATARFEQPASLSQVTDLLAAGGWSLLAGGTDVYPARVGRAMDGAWIDLTRVGGLRGVREDEHGWTFGATTTWTDVLRADLPPLFDALKQAAREVGGVQIQNTGTVAGNLCNASPAADGTPVWMALDAQVLLQSQAGERRMPVAEFVLANRRTARAPHELVTGLHVPRRSARARSVFLKLGGRRYLVISVTMVAVVIDVDTDVDGSGRVAQLAAAVGSCSARAQRLPALEARLRGQPLLALAGTAIDPSDLAPLSPIADVRASAAYRLDATATLLRRALRALACVSPSPPGRGQG
ncbi:MAG: xanthine dehydrogenase [Methylibium sp. NZG]|nr:MAG: xanthine dehydrogenase [Methylibium sp. NZG]